MCHANSVSCLFLHVYNWVTSRHTVFQRSVQSTVNSASTVNKRVGIKRGAAFPNYIQSRVIVKSVKAKSLTINHTLRKFA